MAKIAGDLDLLGGMMKNARVESVAALPVFIGGVHEGRIYFVTGGANQGFWFGADDGTTSFHRLNLGTTLATYSVSDQSINNGVTFQATLTPSGTGAEKGFVAKLSLTSSIGAGSVTVRLYEDVARTSKFYDAVLELSALSIDRIPTFFDVDNSSGNIYVDIINNSGSNGTFSLSITVAGVLLVQVPQPPGAGSGINSGVAGEGIAYDSINSRLLVDLASNPGLEFTGSGADQQIRVKTDPSGGLARAAAGLQTDSSVLRTTTDQTSITGVKSFSSLAMTPSGITGPPTSGAHVAGEFSMDQNKDIWLCTSSGTPGTWVFFGFKETRLGGASNGSSYTGAIAGGSSVVLELAVTGRRGWIRKMNLWGAASSFAVADLDLPFRVACYPNENTERREQLWAVSGQVRSTSITGAVSIGASVIPLNTVGIVNLDDLLRLRKVSGGPLEEYQRITVRSTSPVQVTVAETTVNSFASNDLAFLTTEFTNLEYSNNSGVAANQKKIYLRIFNDHPSTAIQIGYDIRVEEMGGGVTLS